MVHVNENKPRHQMEIINHTLAQRIVKHLGLASVMDIDQIFEQHYKYEVILEDGSRKIVNKSAVGETYKVGDITVYSATKGIVGYKLFKGKVSFSHLSRGVDKVFPRRGQHVIVSKQGELLV